MTWFEEKNNGHAAGEIGEKMFKAFARENGVITSVKGTVEHTTLAAFIKTGRDIDRFDDFIPYDRVPGLDHGVLSLMSDGSAILIFHPYVSRFDYDECKIWTEENGLELHMFPEKYDWYSEDAYLAIISEPGKKFKVANCREDFE